MDEEYRKANKVKEKKKHFDNLKKKSPTSFLR